MLKLSDAITIIETALSEARSRSLAPLVVAVLDAATGGEAGAQPV